MTTKTLKIDISILPHDSRTNVDFFIMEKDLYLSSGYNGHYVVFESFHFDIRLTSKWAKCIVGTPISLPEPGDLKNEGLKSVFYCIRIRLNLETHLSQNKINK